MIELAPTYQQRSASQRREASRRAVHLECEAVRDRGFVLAGRRLLDLSSQGAFLESERDLDLGEEIILSFRAPRTRLWMDARGIVVRRIEGKRRSDRARGVGLQFLPMDAPDRAVLEATLIKVPPTLPSRPIHMDYAKAIQQIALG
jgi:Tfp pilus assembly protein PilZ